VPGILAGSQPGETHNDTVGHSPIPTVAVVEIAPTFAEFASPSVRIAVTSHLTPPHPTSHLTHLASFLPSEAGEALYSYPIAAPAAPTGPAADAGLVVLDSWQSLAVLVDWAVVVLVAGCVLVKRWDA
jgi:hypothetical protein